MNDTITLPRAVVEQAQMWIPLLTEMVGLDPETTSAEFSEFSDGRPASAFTIANVIAALRAALEQPQVEQEPVAFVRRRVADDFSIRINCVVTVEDFAGDTKQFLAWCEAHAERGWTPLYTRPQPPRQPLTDEQIACIEDGFSNEFGLEAKHSIDFARAIERAHGIGGEG